MADYAKWDEKFVAVTSLYLDPLNPRIPSSDTALSQRALIAELVEHDKVLDLAKDIAENGYVPIESLIGFVDSDGKTYVLEGNRRLAALKLLLSPDSAPEATLKKVRALAKQVGALQIKKVRVLHAPSRSEAAPLIMRKHTRPQIESWSPLMKARFYRTLVSSGLTVAEIAAQYGTTAGEVADFLRTDSTYELARRVAPADIKAQVNDPREFEISTLQRIMDNAKAREQLGVEFDTNGEIKGKVDVEEFKRAFGRVLTDIVKQKINTRSVNKKEDIERYMAEIRDDLPNKRKKGSFTASDFETKRPPAPAEKPTKAKPKKSAPAARQSKSLVASGTKCRVKSHRIGDIFEELRTTNLDEKPNTSAVLFRILVELAIGHYLDKTKKIEPLLARAKKEGKAKDWYPTLRQMLDAMLKDTDFPIPTLARKKLNILVSNATSPLSVDGLDSYVHNRFSPPTATELRSYWEVFEGILLVALDESQWPSPTPPPSGKS
ncbi:MAG: hypothetical protein JWN04_4266 [Myxococcaceae bacterium]|nr:hypothetical protein [Myxococcaceae bacterium]